MKKGCIYVFRFKKFKGVNLVHEKIGIVCDINDNLIRIFAIDGKEYRIIRKNITQIAPADIPAEAASALEEYAKLYKEREKYREPLKRVEKRMKKYNEAFFIKSMGIIPESDFLKEVLNNLPEEVREKVGSAMYLNEMGAKEFGAILDKFEGTLTFIAGKQFFYPYDQCSFLVENESEYTFKAGYKKNNDYIELLEKNQPLLPIEKEANSLLVMGCSLNEFIVTTKYTVSLSGEPYTKKYARKLAKQFK